jgi:N-acetylneuraminic acid mutarotase
VRNKLYVFGGYGGGTGRLDDFHSFDFDTNSWEEVPVLSSERPERRENNGVVIGGGTRLYLFGGYNGSAWLNDLWMFDIVTQCWECIQKPSDLDSDSDSQIDHTIDVAAGNTFNGGRVGEASAREASGEHERLNIRPSRRFGYVSVVHEENFILWGGFDGSKWLNDMYEFNFRTKVWRQIEAQGELPSVRSCPAWSSDDSQLFIQGGYDGIDRKADFFACDLRTYTWKEMPCLGTPPSPRYFHSCSLYGNKMFVYGGYSGSERLSDMYAYDFETNHWNEVDCSNGDVPSGRSSLVAQVYRNCMYIFGGYNGSVVLNVSLTWLNKSFSSVTYK